MDLKHALRNGMRVVGPDNREYGTIDRYDDAAVYVHGRRVPFAAIERVDRDRLYLEAPELWRIDQAPPGGASLGGETRIPVLEEQLEFATREIDLGEIRVHKTVEEAEEVRSGQLNREDVEVARVRVDRRVAEPEQSRQEGDWLVIPVMEEVFVVEKHLMVTEEIRIRKRLVTEDAQVRDTVRRERATVEDTRVPRDPLITEAVMPGSAPRPAPGQRAARDAHAPAARADRDAHAPAARTDRDAHAPADRTDGEDAGWQRLHREIEDAGR